MSRPAARVDKLFEQLEPTLDEIMETIQVADLSLFEQREVITQVAAWALGMGAAVTDEIDGNKRAAPDLVATRAFCDRVLKVLS